MRLSFSVIVLVFTATSCINRNLMFRTPKDAEEVSENIPLKPTEDYHIYHDDKFTFDLYTQNGEKIVEGLAGMNEASMKSESPVYIVESNGMAKLPVLGDVRVEGLTVRNLEDTLAFLYSGEYKNPFVQVRLTNQRVIVFPGAGAEAKVIPLLNNNTTLMEALAQAGGIAERGRADKVKIMRSTKEGRKVYLINLSTIEGLKYADMIVQANDYIYVEPSEQVVRETAKEIAPVISIISSTLVIFTVISTLKK